MNKPRHQKLITYIGLIAGGFIVAGSLLDTINNSIDLITPPITYVGTILAGLITLSLQFYLKRNPISWKTKDGQLVHVKSLGWGPKSVLAGILLALWMPRLVSLKPLTQGWLRPKQAVEDRQRPGETGHPQKPLDLQSFNFNSATVDARGNVTGRRGGPARSFIEDLGDGVTLDMVWIPGGDFLMGSVDSDAERAFENAKQYQPSLGKESFTNELPRHPVKVPAFFMGKFEVTQAQWLKVMGRNPSEFKGDSRYPVERVTWEDATEFCERLSGRTGRIYRLPTEAEWEYACRAGMKTPFAFGDTITPDLVNYESDHPYGNVPRATYRGGTLPVGHLGAANGFGLYDMHGNVMEWCFDGWHEDYVGAPPDGSAWLSQYSTLRVARGGGWLNDAFECRCAFRNGVAKNNHRNNLGFRVVMVERP